MGAYDLDDARERLRVVVMAIRKAQTGGFNHIEVSGQFVDRYIAKILEARFDCSVWNNDPVWGHTTWMIYWDKE